MVENENEEVKWIFLYETIKNKLSFYENIENVNGF